MYTNVQFFKCKKGWAVLSYFFLNKLSLSLRYNHGKYSIYVVVVKEEMKPIDLMIYGGLLVPELGCDCQLVQIDITFSHFPKDIVLLFIISLGLSCFKSFVLSHLFHFSLFNTLFLALPNLRLPLSRISNRFVGRKHPMLCLPSTSINLYQVASKYQNCFSLVRCQNLKNKRIHLLRLFIDLSISFHCSAKL